MGPNSDPSLREFFAKMRAEGGVVVQESSRLDLGQYIQNYNGRTRFDRLLFIGKSSVPLCLDALHRAVAEAKKGRDVTRYKAAWDCIRVAAPGTREAIKDEEWIVRVNTANTNKTKDLEAAHKNHKNALIKESIRMSTEELGHHYESIGLLTQAAEAYGRMRQDVSSTKHILECSLRLGILALDRREFNGAISHMAKAMAIERVDEPPFDSLPALAKAVSGVAYIGLRRMDEAAKAFISMPWMEEMPANVASIVSQADIATYGGLLALATMDKHALRSQVLESSTFRPYIQCEPSLRKAINSFVSGRYPACLAILQSMQPEFYLDIHLQKHIDRILASIRSKCIIEYTKPFSCVTIDSLDQAFAPPGESIQAELVQMIQSGALNARIDLMDKTLKAVRIDPRAQMQKEVLNTASRYEREAKERLRRIGIINAGLEVTTPARNRAHDYAEQSGTTGDEAFFEEYRDSTPGMANAEA